LVGLAVGFEALARPLTAQQSQSAVIVAAGGASTVTAGIPTFYADVLPIMQENCQACHQTAGLNMGGNIAPFPLLTYEDASRRAGRIATAVDEGRMPP